MKTKAFLFRGALIWALLFSSLFASPLFPVVLHWECESCPDIAGFRVYSGLSSGVYCDTVQLGKTNSYEMTGLEQGTVYYVSVTSCDAWGNESDFSPELIIKNNAPVSVCATGPRVLSAVLLGSELLVLTFDKKLDRETATETSHYGIQGIEVIAASMDESGVRVYLQTSSHGYGDFSLSVSGIRDCAASPNTSGLEWIAYSSTLSGINDGRFAGPAEFKLHQNFPNPFNPETTIRFSVKEPGPVSVSVYNLLGEKIRILYEGEAAAASTQRDLVWDGRDRSGMPVASGMYICLLEQGKNRESRRMHLVR
ncbi:T9SS type A sorting domain-containing protein [bacterium]|nr:T9SS type A sorting domain-containing protein [bacterium]